MPLHRKDDPMYAGTANTGMNPGYGANTTGTHHATHAPGAGVGGAGLAQNLPGPAPTTAGPHKSDMLNKLDPSVDSDMSNPKTQAAFAELRAAQNPGPATTTAGPHKSNLLNKLDPRVDSDMSQTRGHGHHGAAGGVGAASTVPGANQAVLEERFGERAANTVDPPLKTGMGGTSHATGTHATGTHAAGYGAAGGAAGYGAGAAGTHHHNTVGGGVREGEYGPHTSRVGNAADPRVDSDLDGRGGHHHAAGGAAPMGAPHAGGPGYGAQGGMVEPGYGGAGAGVAPGAGGAYGADPSMDPGYGRGGGVAPGAGMGAGMAGGHHNGPGRY